MILDLHILLNLELSTVSLNLLQILNQLLLSQVASFLALGLLREVSRLHSSRLDALDLVLVTDVG